MRVGLYGWSWVTSVKEGGYKGMTNHIDLPSSILNIQIVLHTFILHNSLKVKIVLHTFEGGGSKKSVLGQSPIFYDS